MFLGAAPNGTQSLAYGVTASPYILADLTLDSAVIISATLFEVFNPICSIQDTVDGADSFSLSTIHTLSSSVAVLDSTTCSIQNSATFTETSQQTDAFHFVLSNLLTANTDISTNLAPAIAAILTSTELLAHTDTLAARVTLATNLLETLVAADVFAQVANLTETETVDLATALSGAVQAELNSTATAAMSDVLQNAVVFTMSESAAMGDTAGLSFSAFLDLSDGAAFIVNLPLEEGDFSAWVMNADTTGVTTYSNFPMLGLASYQGVPYGLTETGLYRLEGGDDDGDPIAAMVATGDMDFGTSRDKNVPRAYLYITQSGETILKTITQIRGSRHETYYELAARTTDGGDETLRRVPLGRGVRGAWWRFELHNVDGADFELDGAEVRPVILSRRG